MQQYVFTLQAEEQDQVARQMRFGDTNIFIRYLTRDDPDQAKACFELFKRAGANEITPP